MDDQGRLIIPAQLRKDGKPFIGATFEETKVLEDSSAVAVGNRHERRAAAAAERKIKELESLIKAQTK